MEHIALIRFIIFDFFTGLECIFCAIKHMHDLIQLLIDLLLSVTLYRNLGPLVLSCSHRYLVDYPAAADNETETRNMQINCLLENSGSPDINTPGPRLDQKLSIYKRLPSFSQRNSGLLFFLYANIPVQFVAFQSLFSDCLSLTKILRLKLVHIYRLPLIISLQEFTDALFTVFDLGHAYTFGEGAIIVDVEGLGGFHFFLAWSLSWVKELLGLRRLLLLWWFLVAFVQEVVHFNNNIICHT